ncbi:hypothetical protein D3C87_111170 [compost metagenome]
MKNFKRVLVLMVSAFSLYSTSAVACGGADLTDDDILNSKELAAVTARIYEVYGKIVDVEEILRSGNKILNMDKVEVAKAMCDANYHHVYMTTNFLGELRCLAMFESDYPGQIKVDGGKIRVSCKADGGKEELVVVPFRK